MCVCVCVFTHCPRSGESCVSAYVYHKHFSYFIRLLQDMTRVLANVCVSVKKKKTCAMCPICVCVCVCVSECICALCSSLYLMLCHLVFLVSSACIFIAPHCTVLCCAVVSIVLLW